MSKINIKVESRFASMEPKIQSQNLGDQIALLFYGKRMISCSNGRGILGQNQSVRTNSISGPVNIYLPSSIKDNSSCKEHVNYIESMVRHATSKGVNVTIVPC